MAWSEAIPITADNAARYSPYELRSARQTAFRRSELAREQNYPGTSMLGGSRASSLLQIGGKHLRVPACTNSAAMDFADKG